MWAQQQEPANAQASWSALSLSSRSMGLAEGTGRPAGEFTNRYVTKRDMNENEITALEKAAAEIDADLAKKYPDAVANISGSDNEDEDDDVAAAPPKRQNPFAIAGGDSSDSEDEHF